MKKNKIYIIACMVIGSLMFTLGSNAQDRNDKCEIEKEIEIVLSNDSDTSKKGNKLMIIFDSETEKGKNVSAALEIKAGDEKKIIIPGNTVKINISSSLY